MDNYNKVVKQVPETALMGACPECGEDNMQRLFESDGVTTAGAQCNSCFVTVVKETEYSTRDC